MQALCGLCGHPLSKELATNHTFQMPIYRCGSCQLLQTQQPSKKAIDRLNSEHRRNWLSKEIQEFRERSGHRARDQLRFCLETKSSAFKQGIGVDIGAGIGVMCQEMTKHFTKVFGVESDETSRKIMAELLNVITITDAMQSPSEIGLCCMSHVLEHIPNALEMLTTVKEKLGIGGYLFVELPNEGSMIKDTNLSRNVAAFNFGHLFHFDIPSLTRFLSRIDGLEIVCVKQAGFPVSSWLCQMKCDPDTAIDGQLSWIRMLARRVH